MNNSAPTKIKAAPPGVQRARVAVLQALLTGPRDGAALRDDLAARAGSKEAVSTALAWARLHGFASCLRRGAGSAPATWTITDAGREWLAEGAPR